MNNSENSDIQEETKQIPIYEYTAYCTKCSKSKKIECVVPQSTSLKCDNCGHIILEAKLIKGYIYILSNPAMPNVVKVGFTTRKVEERVAELNLPTSIPTPFNIDAYFTSENPQEDEKIVHKQLDQYRIVGNREFFQISPDEAENVISQTLNREASYVNPEPVRYVEPTPHRNAERARYVERTCCFVCPVCNNVFVSRQIDNSNYRPCPRCGATSYM